MEVEDLFMVKIFLLNTPSNQMSNNKLDLTKTNITYMKQALYEKKLIICPFLFLDNILAEIKCIL